MLDTIHMGGRAMVGFGLGAPTDPYATASAHYAQLVTKNFQAKNLLATGAYAQAIQLFQSIGNEAAASLGPQIDAGPYPQVTGPWTGDAWTLNGQLAKITPTADGTVAQAASATLDRMFDDYSTAIYKAHVAMGIAPDTGQESTWPYVTFAGAVLAAAGTAIYLLVHQ